MDNKSFSFLLDWTINFVKYKDSISKKIKQIENGKDGFDLYVKYIDKENYFIIVPTIESIESLLNRLNNSFYFSIVTLNSNNNFKMLLDNWSKLINYKLLSIIFVNPFSELDKKWIIVPSVHDKICDESSIKCGLKSMFESTEAIDEEQLIKKISQYKL